MDAQGEKMKLLAHNLTFCSGKRGFTKSFQDNYNDIAEMAEPELPHIIWYVMRIVVL